MDFGAFLAMIVLFVAAPAVVFNGIAKLRRAGTTAGGEMRASELRAMIRSAVDEATVGLAARVTDLEERLGDEPAWALRERLGSGPRADALDPDALDTDAEFDAPEPSGRRRARA